MTTADDRDAGRERRFPDTGRPERDVPDAPDAGPATVPGLVVTEERLADGRAITYFGTAGTTR